MIVAGTHASFEQDRGPRGKHSACGALCPGNFHLIGGYCIGSGGHFVRQRRSAVFSGPAKVINFRKAMILFYKRSEEHTSELQSLMRISYAAFCLKKKKTDQT